ncbi:heme-binding Shp domain-containing protein [Paenibacillus sp. FSL K6-1230]|uniref:heme-binding Shp domain-containing protein n=1 Tax=Paenibacillus sp. FSL K6-1230 TaxID=2921603 RepID=UPI0030FC3628
MSRRYFTSIVTVGLACMLLMVIGPLFGGTATAAGLDKGLYLLDNKTYYTNPDTGKVDDGGDTSIGNGMSRNVTYSKSLLEVRDGKYLVTLRMKMISYISKVTIHVQKSKGDGDAYSPVSFKITGENKAEDTRDYQFEVSDPTLFIKPVIYVEPMGRDVMYFVSLLEDSAQPDKGSFQAYNQTSKQQTSAAEPDLPQGISMESSDNSVSHNKSAASTSGSTANTKSGNSGTPQGDSSSEHKTDKNDKAGKTDKAGDASSKQKQNATPALPSEGKQSTAGTVNSANTASQANKEKQSVPTAASASASTSGAEAQDSTDLTANKAHSAAQQASEQQATEQHTESGDTNPAGGPSSSADQMDAASKDGTVASEQATEGVAAPIATDIIASGADVSDDEVGIVEFDQSGARQNERAASATEDEGGRSGSLLSMPALLLVLLAVCAAGLYLMKLMKLRKK